MPPSKVICIGKNYVAHAREMGGEVPKTPTVFLKPPSAIIANGDAIERPDFDRVDYEGELALVLGRGGKSIRGDQALDHVAGYTCANDVTVRDLQRAGGPWSLAKGMDTFLPFADELVTRIDPRDIGIETRVNGDVRQSARTSQMAFSVVDIIVYVSRYMTLAAGDIILTGTPAGVGNLNPGDVVEVEIEGIGTLRNPVTVTADAN